mmetsp:Transcript_13226/g.33578  ORF Transcript_13226/g.33578 Transcript_13226/m.33578 type:complete len:202 (-) Transcript_13226:1076-1681(-)
MTKATALTERTTSFFRPRAEAEAAVQRNVRTSERKWRSRREDTPPMPIAPKSLGVDISVENQAKCEFGSGAGNTGTPDFCWAEVPGTLGGARVSGSHNARHAASTKSNLSHASGASSISFHSLFGQFLLPAVATRRSPLLLLQLCSSSSSSSSSSFLFFFFFLFVFVFLFLIGGCPLSVRRRHPLFLLLLLLLLLFLFLFL